MVSTPRKLYNPGAKATGDTFQHILAEMTDKVDFKYTCKICPSKQATSSAYVRHLANHDRVAEGWICSSGDL